MTDTATKIRSLFLTALMVVSVFGGTVAFAGTAAAATNTSASLSDQTVEATGVTLTTSAEVELTSDNDMDYLNVTLPGADFSSVTTSDITVDHDGQSGASGSQYGGSTGASSVTVNGDTLAITLQNTVQVGDTENIRVTVNNVENPSTTGDKTVTTDLQTTTQGESFESYDATVTINDASGDSSTSANAPDTVSVTELSTNSDNDLAPSQNKESAIEVAFDEATFNDDGNALSDSEVEVYLDGEDVSSRYSIDSDASDGQLILSSSSDVEANADLEVNFTVPLEDSVGNNATFENVTVDVTGTTAQQSSSAADSSEDDSADQTVYEGTDVAVYSDQGTTNTGLTIDTDSDEFVFDGSTGENSEVYTFDSNDRNVSAIYQFNFGSGTNTYYELGLRNLGLSGSVDETNVTTDDEITGSASANAGNRDVDVTLTAPDDTETTQTITLDNAGDGEFSFSAQSDTGDYEINVTDVQTGNSVSTDDVSVSEAAEGSASFDQTIIETPRGDVVEMNISLTGVETARVQIGDKEELNYYADLTVTDGNEDGEVALQFNTNDNSFSTADTPTGEDSDSVNVNNNGPATAILDSSDYSANVSVGGDEEAVATVVLTDRGTDEVVLWTSADEDYGQISSGSDVAPFVEDGNLTQTSQVAKGDTLVHQIKVTGVYGAVQAELDAGADNATVALTNVLSDPDVDLTVVQTNPTANQDRKVLDIAATSAGAINVVADSDNGTLYVNVDTSEAVFDRTSSDDWEPSDTSGEYSGSGSYTSTSDDVELEDGDRFNATFFVGENSDLSDDNEAVSAQFGVTDRTASFDSSRQTADNEPLVTTQNAAGQTVSGTTSVAPGTNVTVRARATGDSPFLKTQEVEVQPDGTFAATLDFSDVSTGTNFTLTVPQQNFEDNVETDGRVAPKPTASASISDQTTDGTTVTVDSATLSDGGFVTIHDGSLADGAVFDSVRGTSAYLEAGSHSDIEVSLDAPYESDGTVIAMPHQDTNDNQAYDFVSSDGAEDGPYTADGAAVTDRASLTVETSTTPTPTDSPTPDEQTPTEETPTPTGTDGQPGFGAALAIVALAGAALLALRRE